MSEIIVFGEVLFDKYPDKSVIGGAPFNFCSHLCSMGHKAYMLTGIGDDNYGKNVLDFAEKFNIDKKLINTVSAPTGICRVNLSENGIPSYNLIENQAYDNIVLTEEQYDFLKSRSDRCLYFGTLAQRNTVSADTLRKILSDCKFTEIFFDINIRQNFYSDEILDSGLIHTTILKFSREEAWVFRKIGIEFSNEKELCRNIYNKYKNIKYIIVTLDKDGAYVYDCKNESFILKAAKKTEIISTVGAGDSFFAGYIHGFLTGRSPDDCLTYAINISSYVIAHLDAVPEYNNTIKAKLHLI